MTELIECNVYVITVILVKASEVNVDVFRYLAPHVSHNSST